MPPQPAENKNYLEPKAGTSEGVFSLSEPEENVSEKPDPHSRWKFYPILKMVQTFPAEHEDHDKGGSRLDIQVSMFLINSPYN